MIRAIDSIRDDHLTQVAASVPFISIVMPVRNEEACLGKLLGQLFEQNYPQERYEVLVIDGGSTDGTRGIVQELLPTRKNLRLLDNPRRLSSAARNIGVQAAQGELIVVVDGHCELPNNDYLRNLAAAFERSGADCLGRPQPLRVASPSYLERAIGLARASKLGHHPASYIYGSNEQRVPAHSVAVAYRRRVFEQVGLFDERFDACEDVELNHRVDQSGMCCLLVPELAVSYRPRGSLRALLRQLVRYGRGRMRLLRKHPDTLSFPGLMPAFALVGAAIGWVGSFVWSWWAVAYLAAIVAYILLVASTSLFIACRVGHMRLFPTLCVVFVTIHFGAALGMIQEECHRMFYAPQQAERSE